MKTGAEIPPVNPVEQTLDELARNLQRATSALNGVASMAIEGDNGRRNGLTDEQVLAKLRETGTQVLEATAWLENILHRRATAVPDTAESIAPQVETTTFTHSNTSVFAPQSV